MTQLYQLIANSTSVLRRADNATIPDDPANRDRQEYDQWLAEGNMPDPAPLPPEPPPPEPVTLPAAVPTNPLDATPKAYVDNAIAAQVNPLRERIEALEARMLAQER